jgi:flagellar hook-associated protein 1 FlgK
MGGLLDSLSSANSALTAYRLALDVTGQNIANIDTPGYTRRMISLAELSPVDVLSAGRGVEVTGITAARDLLVEARLGREMAGSASDAALLEGLTEVEAAIGLPGSSLDAQLTAFFDTFAALAVDVTSPSARDAVVQAGETLATTLHDLASRFTLVQGTSDLAIRAGVDEVNTLAARVAALNAAIARGGPDVESLRDERTLAIQRLAELVNVSSIDTAEGSVTVTMASGHALVVGGESYLIEVTSTAPNGYASLSINDVPVTTPVLGGRLGGLAALRDVVVPQHMARLDQLAYDLAVQVNAVHQTGFDAAGAAGGAFFAPPSGVAGAAALLQIDPALAADSQLVAGSATGAPGDNQTARALAGLRDARWAAGGTATPSEAWAQIVYGVGLDVASTRASVITRTQVVRQLERLRDQASGVSLDEEAAHLMRYQRAYEASARYFTTIVDTLDTLMQMVR